ncbi:MAG: hypothetical protein S4CHLAM81_04850 [Chlamydiales bacterium]|nr:hypothetical protein [Chlamydiales bacterium]MCH9635274.1 hypothetical protein [Chlamydiales bacterium]
MFIEDVFSQSSWHDPGGNTVQKIKNIGLLVLCGAILTTCNLYAVDDQLSLESATFSTIEGTHWVEKCVELYPEISWLADAKVRNTEEGYATLNGTYSEQLFGQKYIEFDRTIMSMHCLRLILDGDDRAYQTFTASQTNSKLSRDSFRTLHLQGQKLLQSKWNGMSELQMAQAMETALVLGDIGKSEKARELFQTYGVDVPDHDDFHGEAMQVLIQHPRLCPSFDRLPSAARLLLLKSANLAHYGHITHLEGGPCMFSNLKDSMIPSTDPIALSFDLFIHTCDVAGALGHVNNQSSLVCTESAYCAMQAVGASIRILANPNKTEWDAYNAYLAARASWLGLDINVKAERILVRIGAMLRLFNREEGCILREAIFELGQGVRDKIILQLDVQQGDSSRTPTYMPAVLVNLANNSQLGLSQKDRLFKAIKIGLPFIARVLERHKELLASGEIEPHIPLNFNKMAGIAKSFPDLLENEFSINKEGIIYLVF